MKKNAWTNLQDRVAMFVIDAYSAGTFGKRHDYLCRLVGLNTYSVLKGRW